MIKTPAATCPKWRYILMRLGRRFCPEPIARRFVSSEKSGPDRIVRIFDMYQKALQRIRYDLRGKVVVEVGAGVYNPGSLGLLGLGARKIFLLEPYYFRPKAAKFAAHVRALCDAVNAKGEGLLNSDDIFGLRDNAVLLNQERIGVISPAGGHWPLDSGKVDTILSASVLEHVRDLRALVAEMARCLRTGGVAFHYVDLRDHYFRYPFDMLKYSKFMWERVLTTRRTGGGYQNRFRLSQIIRQFREAGLMVRVVDKTVALEPLRSMRAHIHMDFATFDDEDLATVEAGLTLQKP